MPSGWRIRFGFASHPPLNDAFVAPCVIWRMQFVFITAEGDGVFKFILFTRLRSDPASSFSGTKTT